MSEEAGGRTWPSSLTEVPYWVYQDERIHQLELRRIFEGACWHFVCLEAELREPGDFRTLVLGEMPVIVVRDREGEVRAFENRCSHRGSLLALEESGNCKHTLQCVYHAWSFDLKGSLVGVAFQKGSNGRGGMPATFDKNQHGLRRLHVTIAAGLVFVSVQANTPPLREYLGDAVLAKLERVLARPVEILCRYTQALPANWKAYAENVRDPYHASLLHAFYGTFKVSRLTQEGGMFLSALGGSSVAFSVKTKTDHSSSYRDQQLRSEKPVQRLADPTILDTTEEFGDNLSIAILSVFPNLVVQQIQNSLAVRRIVPRGVDRTDLEWTVFGFADDSAELRALRMKHLNLVGPGGLVSMEDGCVVGFVQRGTAAAPNEHALLAMGGEGIESQDFKVSEVGVRGFWSEYRHHMGL